MSYFLTSGKKNLKAKNFICSLEIAKTHMQKRYVEQNSKEPTTETPTIQIPPTPKTPEIKKFIGKKLILPRFWG